MEKTVTIAGGTGFIGKFLTDKLIKSGYKVKILSRNIKKFESAFTDYKSKNIEPVYWDENSDLQQLTTQIENSYGIINLSGVNVSEKRWNEEFKKLLYDSRINSTRQLIEVMSALKNKPECFISISGVGFYGNRYDEILDESSKPGNDFLSRLVIDWENAAKETEKLNIRTVIFRTGIVLEKNNGALKELIKPFKFYAGGYISPGSQYMSVIHIDDLTDLFLFCLENKNISGVINAVSPEPVTNKEFSKTLGKVLKKPCLFIIPGFALKIIVGEFAESLTGGQRVIPKKATDNNFKFKYSNLISTLNNLLK
ncbi:MAG: TIGR01777 family protein [Ignavibacteria bacterium]|nr:TIGR01777 family protein [Ignavibacteria bacterium]